MYSTDVEQNDTDGRRCVSLSVTGTCSWDHILIFIILICIRSIFWYLTCRSWFLSSGNIFFNNICNPVRFPIALFIYIINILKTQGFTVYNHNVRGGIFTWVKKNAKEIIFEGCPECNYFMVMICQDEGVNLNLLNLADFVLWTLKNVMLIFIELRATLKYWGGDALRFWESKAWNLRIMLDGRIQL